MSAVVQALTSPTTIVDQVGPKMLHIPHEPLRRHLVENVMGHRVVPFETLHEEDDTDIVKRRKDREALFNLSRFVQHYSRFVKNPVEEINEEETPGLCAYYTQLVDLLTEHKTTMEAEVKAAFDSGVVTFEQLHLGIKPSTLFATYEEDVLIAVQAQSADIKESFFGNYLEVRGQVYAWNGKEVATETYSKRFGAYDGSKSFKDLGIVVVTAEVQQALVERGEKYLRYNRGPYYGTYAGSLVQRQYWSTQRFNATGRIMIDMMSMQRADPNYDQWFAGIEPGNYRREKETISAENLSPDVLACMSPYVYGFSFVSKQWGEMVVDKVSEVKFRHDAYDKLVLNEDDKETVLDLVESEDLHSMDFVDGKGGGCIFLLAGNPGCGKTLTAEAVAEKLGRPLYAVGIGELGTNADVLEQNLTRILETAALWRAVLLLDEADIFLEERSDLNIERNAMVGVFLRLLEYYPGILFLTSNRALRIDKAFYSRISLALQYKDLDVDTRKKVWGNFVQLYAGHKISLSESDLDKLAGRELNGRQIKNVVRIGLIRASKVGRAANFQDFHRVIERVEAFNKPLN